MLPKCIREGLINQSYLSPDAWRVGRPAVAYPSELFLILEIERLTTGEETRLRRIRLATLEEAAAWPDSRWTEQILTLPTFIAAIGGQNCGMVRGAPHSTRQDAACLISM